MWVCQSCHENHDENIDVCWNCGTSKWGKEDPGFVAEPEPGPEARRELDLDDLLTLHFHCQKCSGTDVLIRRLNRGMQFHPVLAALNSDYLETLTCHHCGYTEIFNTAILKDRENLGEFIESLFRK